MLENFGKGFIGKAVRGLTFAGAVLSGADSLKASQKAIAEATKAIKVAEFDLDQAQKSKDPNKIVVAQKALVEAKADLEIAKAEDKDEKQGAKDASKIKSTELNIGQAPKNEAVIKGTSRSQKVSYDSEGKTLANVVTAEELSEAEMKHREKMAEIDAKKAKDVEKAKNHTPGFFSGPYYDQYNRVGGYSVGPGFRVGYGGVQRGEGGVNTTYDSHTRSGQRPYGAGSRNTTYGSDQKGNSDRGQRGGGRGGR